MSDKQEMRRERLRAAAGEVRIGLSDRLGDLRWWLVVRGLLALALGIFAIFWPSLNLSVLAFLVGVYCLADGAVGLIGALRAHDSREYLLGAFVGLGIGALLVFWPGLSLRTVMVLLGLLLAWAGGSQIWNARRLPPDDPDRNVVTTVAVAALISGLVLMVWPGSGVAVVSWAIGLIALLVGALLLFLANRFRRVQTRLQ